MTTRSKAKQEARLLNSSRKQRSTPMPTATPPADEALKLRRRQSERKKIRERKARELEQRVQNRQREMRDKEQADRCAREQRDSIMDSMKSRVHKRVRGLSYQQLCKEFMPKARLPAHPDKNTLRRNLRRAMAQYHPDRNGMRPVEYAGFAFAVCILFRTFVYHAARFCFGFFALLLRTSGVI